MRSAIIAGNWKMNFGPSAGSNFVKEVAPEIGRITRANDDVLAIFCPPFISLASVKEVLDAVPAPRMELGAQNLYFQEMGAYTGEVSPSMVKEFCGTVIIGHSERRAYFGETDEVVNQKLLAAFKHELRPIVCIGENLSQYEAGETRAVITEQVHKSLANLSPEQALKIVIAYEPIWAIGTGKAATAEIALEVIQTIRATYGEIYGPAAAEAVHILYGGSVTAANIADFMVHPDIDGALVGGASLKPEFVEIVRKTAEVRAR